MSIADLTANTPADSDNIGNGAGKIREITNALIEAFPAVAGAIENTSGEGNDPPTHIDFSNLFNRIKALEDAISAADTGPGGGAPISLIPTGLICMWSGTIGNIPAGWALCDGAGGRPDLRDRFIIGAGDTYNVGNTGGSLQTGDSGEAATITLNLADHVLTEANIPEHEHFIAHNSGADPLSPTGVGAGDYAAVRRQDANDDAYFLSAQVGANNNESNVGRTSAFGQASPAPLTHDAASATISGHSHDAVPPYYALAFIIKLAPTP
jgi:hypothetical protein